MELVKEILSLILFTLITGCGVAIVTKLLDAVNAKIDELQTNTQLAEYDKLNILIDQAQSVVTTIVQSINQTLVDSLKASGNFTKESAIEAKNMALDKAHELITEETAKAIETVYGSLDTWLDAVVEQTVNQLKNK